MLRILESHEFACLFNLAAAAIPFWIAWSQRGMIHGLFLWNIRSRWRNITSWDEATRDAYARKAVRWLFIVFGSLLVANGTYHGLRATGILKERPPPTIEELEAAMRRRFDEARQKRGQRQPFRLPAKAPEARPDSN